MKGIIVSLLLLAGLTAHSQSAGDLEKQLQQVEQETSKLGKTQASLDSTMQNLARVQDSLRLANIQKQAARDGEMMLRWQKERQAKQKRQMFMYFGLGIFFLVVLVLRLMRKRTVKR